MAYSNVSMLANHILAQQRRLAERANQFRAGILTNAAGDSAQHADDGNIQMTETRLFVGLNDAEKDTIQRIAEDLCCFFRQESVLITEDVIKGRFLAADQGERRITR